MPKHTIVRFVTALFILALGVPLTPASASASVAGGKPLPFVTLAIQVASGLFHTCAVTDSGAVKCWGNNAYGQLGDGSYVSHTTPVAVSGLSDVKAVTTREYHTCALTNNGAVKCWGDNQFGQLGNSTTVSSATPVAVNGLISNVVAIAAGLDHTCAVINTGNVMCWGGNAQGQLGDGTTVSQTSPVTVTGLTDAVAIATGRQNTCAVTGIGAVVCWGGGWDTQPVTVNGLSDIVAVTLGLGDDRYAAGFNHTCVLTRAGVVECWGQNYYGQTGNGTDYYHATPSPVIGLGGAASAITAGEEYTCGERCRIV